MIELSEYNICFISGKSIYTRKIEAGIEKAGKNLTIDFIGMDLIDYIESVSRDPKTSHAVICVRRIRDNLSTQKAVTYKGAIQRILDKKEMYLALINIINDRPDERRMPKREKIDKIEDLYLCRFVAE